MRKYGWMVLTFTTIFSILFFSWTQNCFAFVLRTGDMIIIGGDEVIDEDIFLTGNEIIINGKINGDLYAAARVIAVNGHVRDSVTLAGNRIDVSGVVGRSLRAIGDSITIKGSIGNDLVLAARDVVLDVDSVVSGDMLTGAMNTIINGPVKGYALVGARSVTVGNIIGGDATFGTRFLTLTKNAVIGGNLTYYSVKEASIDSGASIRGKLKHSIPQRKFDFRKFFPFMIIAGVAGKIAAFFMGLAVGLVFILLAPGWLNSLTEAIRQKTGTCAGWGVLMLFAIPIGVIIAFSTVIGIVLGAIALFLYLIAVYLGQIAAGLLVGKMILGRFDVQESTQALFGVFALGYFIIRLFRFIPVAGHLIFIAAAAFGLGAVFVTVVEKRKKASKEN